MSDKAKKELHNKIIKGLQSNDSNVVKDSIQQLREEGQIQDIVVLFDMLLNNPDQEIEDVILQLFADIKDKNAVQIFVDAIKSEKYLAIRKDLVGICWQSSLDFTPYVSVFTDLLVDSDFETTFEAFTVIENFTGKLEDGKKSSEQNKLKNAIPNARPEVKEMIHECIHILEQF